MKEEWTKRGEMPSICVTDLFPWRSCVIGRDPGLARRACYVMQVPGDKCGMV
jgi:hypothetical protein